MFHIAAINDTDSRGQWEPLAPTKEAQEFRLSQAYHEGLLQLDAKQYSKAQELFETVLRDPLIISISQADGKNRDYHLQQLRFLALKNLASVFLQQGSTHYESAIRCYLEAVEIDGKDSVVWNQLGTLSCTMGLLSISRWAFEQRLLCSPNNWNCMEKLLEVLIAIKDEISCLSVAQLILRHWPSHSRALHVKKVLQEAEHIPFAPRGIDKLEPRHIRLKFPKRKRSTDEVDDTQSSKKQNITLEVHLSEACWLTLVEAITSLLVPYSERGSRMDPTSNTDMGTKCGAHPVFLVRNGGVQGDAENPSSDDKCFGTVRHSSAKIKIVLPSRPETDAALQKDRQSAKNSPCYVSSSEWSSEKGSSSKEKESCLEEEHPLERRTTRLGKLRNRKLEREDSDHAGGKDQGKLLYQSLESFIVDRMPINTSAYRNYCLDEIDQSKNTSEADYNDVYHFVTKTSDKYGACQLGHLLLEEVACKGCETSMLFKLLELERFTRNWVQDRTPQCSLFLADLCYDLGSCSVFESRRSELFSEASHHLCKVIEVVAVEVPGLLQSCSSKPSNDAFLPHELFSSEQRTIHVNSMLGSGTDHETEDMKITPEDLFTCTDLVVSNSPAQLGCSFWVRFNWLSGRLSVCSNDKLKAYEEFKRAFTLLSNESDAIGRSGIIFLEHCRFVKYLSLARILNEINLLKVGDILSKSAEMIQKGMHRECVDAIYPLLLCNKSIYLDHLLGLYSEQGLMSSIELSALDFLIASYEGAKMLSVDDYLKCRWRKLQILVASTEVSELHNWHYKNLTSCMPAEELEAIEKVIKSSEIKVACEVKSLSDNTAIWNDSIPGDGNLDAQTVPVNIIGEIQNLLLIDMSNLMRKFLCQKQHDPELYTGYFVDAAIAFCKLQHVIPGVPIKAQVDLIAALHETLAVHGLCCAGRDAEGKEGTFLKLAIRHLLALDMKLKATHTSDTKIVESKEEADLTYQSCLQMNDDSKQTIDSDQGQTMENKEAGRVLSLEGMIQETVSSSEPLNKEGINLEGVEAEVDKKPPSPLKAEDLNENIAESDRNVVDSERNKMEMAIENALDQSFFCLYGLNLRAGSEQSCDDDLAIHRNTSRGEYQTKEQCADVFRYLLPYARESSRSGLVKLRRVLRAIRKHFYQPPEDMLRENSIDKFLDSPEVCEEKLAEMAGYGEALESVTNMIFPTTAGADVKSISRSEPYLEVYSNLYYLLSQAEEMNATDKWAGYVLTKEGEEFVEQNTNLYKYDLLYNPLRFESWQHLANIYDEEVDLMLNDGSKHINVKEWRKQSSLGQRVEASRRRSRRCLLMSLALARTPADQSQIHELLALVYYDCLQNVVPLYDQRSILPTRDATWTLYCENSRKHFKKAYSLRPDWSHVYYVGKLSQKLRHHPDKALSYYAKSAKINPSAVDPVYRLHASRLKLLIACEKNDLSTLQVVTSYCFHQSTKDDVMKLLADTGKSVMVEDNHRTIEVSIEQRRKQIEFQQLEEAWERLFSDCVSALEVCVEGELKHFHKARYMLAQGLYRKGGIGDLQRAKEELSFCFKSSRSSFTINMWEIDGAAKKGRRRNPGPVGNKMGLQLGLPESSRKFITCIRKYTLFYLLLLEKTGDFCTLERAHSSLRTDRRFSLCLEDIVPVALGRYARALCLKIQLTEADGPSSAIEGLLEKLFNVFIENGNLWNEMSCLPELSQPSSSEVSESTIFSYVHQYIRTFESETRLEALEGINEKIRKRFKNPKLANSNCFRVCKHASAALCRSIMIRLASITPSFSKAQPVTTSPSVTDTTVQLYVDIQETELWGSAQEDPGPQKYIEEKLNCVLHKIKNMPVKQAVEENTQAANNLLRSTYNFYRDSYYGVQPSGVKLYTVSSRSAQSSTCLDVESTSPHAEVLDLSIPRKFLLWAYTLVHGHYSNILSVVKYCEENIKMKLKRGPTASTTSAISLAIVPAADAGGVVQDDDAHETVDNRPVVVALAASHEDNNKHSPCLLIDLNADLNPEEAEDLPISMNPPSLQFSIGNSDVVVPDSLDS